MSVRYTPISLHNAHDAEHELDAAFESDDDNDDDTSPLPLDSSASTQPSCTRPAPTLPGAYDFEADFDYTVPPPGSPPTPSIFAHPNQYGNSNGQLPTAPAIPSGRHPNLFRRVAGVLLPTHYQRVATEDGIHVVGGGTNNDGVFANLTAKPGRGRIVQDGESIHVVPEEVQKEVPPSYAVAQADAAPTYYETIVHTPSSGLDGEVLVDAMPTGSFFTFAWTMLISLSFQFVGFLLTYLLHTSHASKFGSRAGLGVTIIQYAFFLRRKASQMGTNNDYKNQPWWDSTIPSNGPEATSFSDLNNGTDATEPVFPVSASARTEWLSFLLMTVGWFVLLTSLLGFWRVKRWERGIRQASEPEPSPEVLRRDNETRSMLMWMFCVLPSPDRHETHDSPSPRQGPEPEMSEDQRRLEHNLRASGLL